MEHQLFKPRSLEEGKHGVVGDCNGIPMEVRYQEETPMFARKILSLLGKKSGYILDYGCGVGRISKEILTQNPAVFVTGVDASSVMREFAKENVSSTQFEVISPYSLSDTGFDLACLIYVLQHVPAVEIREILQRIHYSLKSDGYLIYCSSEYRMAIRHDQPGFCDDRFLGVDLLDELSRYFTFVQPLFTPNELEENEVVRKMITGDGGGLPHPAWILKPKRIIGPLFNAQAESGRVVCKGKGPDKIVPVNPAPKKTAQKLVLVQKLAPGDIMMATVALRDLHKTYPGEYITDMRSPANEIFLNNPYITPIPGGVREQDIIERLKSNSDMDPIEDEGVLYCNLHYPMIHESGARGTHFADAMTEFLSKKLGRQIKRHGLRPELYLDFNEEHWPSPVFNETGFDGKYWVLNAGVKRDYTLKQYPFYQEVVDLMIDIKKGFKDGEIKFVQIGHADHVHPALNNVIDMRGKTTLRELFRLIRHAQGVLTCVSLPLHVAAALKKPCVCVAGGREGTRWELYPDHRFIYTNGLLDCCAYDGCWKSKEEECLHFEDGVAKCMTLISPEDVARQIELYYEGGVL